MIIVFAEADALGCLFGFFCIVFCLFVAAKNIRNLFHEDEEIAESKRRKAEREEAERIEAQRKADEESRKRREAARLRDIRLKQAMEELENGTYDRVIWAKALIMADGSQSKARALYLQLRIGEL